MVATFDNCKTCLETDNLKTLSNIGNQVSGSGIRKPFFFLNQKGIAHDMQYITLLFLVLF